MTTNQIADNPKEVKAVKVAQGTPTAGSDPAGYIEEQFPELKISLEGVFLALPNATMPYESIFASWEEALYKYLLLSEDDFSNLLKPLELAEGEDFLNVDFEKLFDIPVDPHLEAAYQASQVASGGGVVSEERNVSFDLMLTGIENNLFKILSVPQSLTIAAFPQFIPKILIPVINNPASPIPIAPDLKTSGAFLQTQGVTDPLINEKYLNLYTSIEIRAHLLFDTTNPFGFDVGASAGSGVPPPSVNAVDASFSSSNQNPAGTQIFADRIVLTTLEGNVLTLYTQTANGHTMGDLTYVINNPISTPPLPEQSIDLQNPGDGLSSGYDDHFLYSIINNYLNSAVGNLHFQIIDDVPETHDQDGPTALEKNILTVGSTLPTTAEVVGGALLTPMNPSGVLIVEPNATAAPLPTNATYFGADKVGALVSKVTLIGVDNATVDGSTKVSEVSNVITTMSAADIIALQSLGLTGSVIGDPAIKITDNLGNVYIFDQKSGEYLYYVNKAFYHDQGSLGNALADIKFAFTLKDGDGDVSNTSILTLHSQDDAPIAFNNTNSVNETHYFVQYNLDSSYVETAKGNLILDGKQDIFGADGKGNIASLTINNVNIIVDGGAGDLDGTVNGSITLNTAYGQIVVDTEGAGMGSYTYTLDINKSKIRDGDTLHSVNDIIFYTIADADGSKSQANLTINIDLNETPVANLDNVTTTEDTTQGFTAAFLLSNDTDPDAGDTKAIASIDTKTKGTVGLVIDNNDGTYTYNPNGKFEYLAKGETTTDSFTYVMKDAEGLTSTATVTVTITGVNDTPIVANVVLTGAVTELVTPVGNLTDNGSIAFTDADFSDVHTVSVSPNGSVLGGLTAVVAQDTTGTGSGGLIDWNYSVVASAVEYLAKDQPKVETFNITLDDGNGGIVVRTVTVTITGTNDFPVVANVDVTGGVTELVTPVGNLTDTGTIGFTDVDLTDTHTISSVVPSVGALGTLNATVSTDTINGVGGVISWDYSVAASAVEYLAQNETKVETFDVTLNDGHGGTVVRTVSVTITGTNDVPVVAATDVTGGVTELVTPVGNLTDTGTIGFTDVDLTDTHTISSIVPSVGALGTLNATVSTDTVNGVGGVISWDYSVAASAVEYLAQNETKVETFDVTLNDGHGGTVVRTVSVTITGTNDVPVVAATDVTGGVTELVTPVGNLTDTGTIGFTDVDLTDTHSISSITSSVGALGTLNATVSTDTVNGVGGVISWDYSVAASAVEYLAQNETKVETFDVTLNDGHGGTVVRTVSVTITGTNDVPVVAATDVTGGVTELVTPVGNLTDTGTIGFTDVDLTDTHSISSITSSVGALGTLNATVSTDTVNGVGGAISWDYSVPASDVEYLAKDETKVETFDITLDDGNGGTVVRTITVTITGTNDAPIATTEVTGGVTEQGTAVGNDISDTGVIGFTDVDLTDSHTVSVSPNGTVLGSLSAEITTDTTGSGLGGEITWVYSVPDTAVEYLAENETKNESFEVTLDDGKGGTYLSTVTITITGTNDEPTGTDKTVTINEDNPYTFGAADFGFSDVDAKDTFKAINISGTPTNGNLFFDNTLVTSAISILISDIGKLVFMPNADENGTSYAQFQFQVQDSSGAANDTDSTANTITIDVTPQNDASSLSDGGTPNADYSLSASTAVVVDPNVNAIDIDSTDLSKATISLTDPQTGDILSLDESLLPAGITISGNETTSITLTGNTSLTEYNTFLQNITFQTSDTTEIDRHIAWQVTDDAGAPSNVLDTTISVVAPIVFDLDGNGFNLVSAKDANMTLGDISGSTAKNAIGWVGEGDGVLMLNSNGDGSITNLNQISFTSYVEGAKTDLQGLIAFDSNHDGFLDKGDDKYGQFGVLTADGKYESLADLGINNISLTSNDNSQLLNGNVIFGTSSYENANGKTMQLADVGFSVDLSNKNASLQSNDVLPHPDSIDFTHLASQSPATPSTTEVALPALPATSGLSAPATTDVSSSSSSHSLNLVEIVHINAQLAVPHTEP